MEPHMTTNIPAPTRLLDYDRGALPALIEARGWRALDPYGQIGAVYTFVRDEIAFGYNLHDALPASRVLAEGRGQCNTKSTLLMALLAGLGHSVRLRGLTIHKSLQRGLVPEWAYGLAGEEVLHSWVEVEHRGAWRRLEGVIMDRPALAQLQSAFDGQGALCAYGVGTDCLGTPEIDWQGQDTQIQLTGVIRDFGTFATPDDFYGQHGQDRGLIRELLFRTLVRAQMNARVRAMRKGRVPTIPGGPDPAPQGAIFEKGVDHAA